MSNTTAKDRFILDVGEPKTAPVIVGSEVVLIIK